MQSELLDRLRDGEKMVFGHRGASAYAPMNTIEAFQLAAELGADGVELDVHRSADGHAVIVHDFTVDDSTDGSGKVAEMTLAQLKALDAGSWKDAKFQGAQIPTLDEVFEAIGSRLFINVEIKSNSFTTDGVERIVAERIAHHKMGSRVLVSSFNPLALRRFRAVMPEVPVGYLRWPRIPIWVRLWQVGLRVEALHPDQDMIDEAYMDRARNSGHVVNTWTVNDPVRARELCDLGVGGIISDRPDVIRDALDQ